MPLQGETDGGLEPLLGLYKVVRGTRTYATRLSDEVAQYLEGVVWRAVQVA